MPEKHHMKATQLLKKVTKPLKVPEPPRKGGRLLKIAKVPQETQEPVKKINDTGKNSEVLKTAGYSLEKVGEPQEVGELLKTFELVMKSGKSLEMDQKQHENVYALSDVKEALKEADNLMKKAGQPLKNVGGTIKRISNPLEKKNESWNLANESAKLIKGQTTPGLQKKTNEPPMKKEPQKNVSKPLRVAENPVQAEWKFLRTKKEVKKHAGEPSKRAAGVMNKESLKKADNPLNKMNESLREANQPLKKANESLVKAEECVKNATGSQKNGVKPVRKMGDSLMKADELKEKALELQNDVQPVKKSVSVRITKPYMKAANSEEMTKGPLNKASVPLKSSNLFQDVVDTLHEKTMDSRKTESNEMLGRQLKKTGESQKIELWRKVKDPVKPSKIADESQKIAKAQENRVKDPQKNSREPLNQLEQKLKKAGDSLNKSEELLKKAEENLKKGMQQIMPIDQVKEIKDISKLREPLCATKLPVNNSKELLRKTEMLTETSREPLKKKIPMIKHEKPLNPQKEVLVKKEEFANIGKSHIKVMEPVKKEAEPLWKTKLFERDLSEEPQNTEKSLKKTDALMRVSVESLKEGQEKKEADLLMKPNEPLKKSREPLKKAGVWNGIDILEGTDSSVTSNVFRKTLNEKSEDECATKERLKSSVYQKGEEEFESDMSLTKAYKLLQCNPLKKSRMFQRKAHKLKLKVLEMERMKGSKLKVDKWEKMILQHSKEKEALKIKLDEMYKKSHDAEKETEKLLKQFFENQNELEKMRQKKKDKNERASKVHSYMNAMLQKTSRKNFVWTEKLREKYHRLEKKCSDLWKQIKILHLLIHIWKNEIEELEINFTRCQGRKLMIEKQRSCAFKKIAYLSKEIAKLKLRIWMVSSPDAFLSKVRRLRKKAADYDYLAKLFQKRQIILQSRVSSLDDNHTVEQLSPYKLFAWTKKDINKNVDQKYKNADQKNSSDQFQILMESWEVSYEEVVRHKKCSTSQMVWNIVLHRWSTKVQKTWKYYQQKSWRWSTNALYRVSTAPSKELSTDPNAFSIQPLKSQTVQQKESSFSVE